MGVLGIIGGGLMILLNLSDIATLITKYFLSFFAVSCFVIGVQGYLTWRWKLKYLRLIMEFDQSIESVSTLLDEMSTDLEKIKEFQPGDPSTPHSPSAQGTDGR